MMSAFLVPHECLPSDEGLRSGILRQLFPQHSSSSEAHPKGWLIDLCWPRSLDAYVDPRLKEGLRWWSPDFTAECIPTAVRSEGQWQLSMSDAWSLYAWSGWLTAFTRGQVLPQQVNLLHVDEHDDLMSPHLYVEPSGWWDAFTGRKVDLLDPATVRSAIESGAIGMENYIPPLVHLIPRLHIRHLRATVNRSTPTRRRLLKSTLLKDDALNRSRPAVRLADDTPDAVMSSHDYVSTPSLEDWLADLPDGPVLLHVDLDYCNNRYNNNVNWKADSWEHDPDLGAALASIDRLFEALSSHGLMDRIVNVSAALSPGFFPAEYWSAAVDRLRLRLADWRPPG